MKQPPEAFEQSMCRDEMSPAALYMGCRKRDGELHSHSL